MAQRWMPARSAMARCSSSILKGLSHYPLYFHTKALRHLRPPGGSGRGMAIGTGYLRRSIGYGNVFRRAPAVLLQSFMHLPYTDGRAPAESWCLAPTGDF